jgi:hypothetical protein
MDAAATPSIDIGALLKRAILTGALLVAAHLVWFGLAAAEPLMKMAGPRPALALPGYGRDALLTHVRASWIALAIVLNAAWLLWRGFRLAAPCQVAAGIVTLYLYFGDVQWRLLFASFPGCLAVLFVAGFSAVQIAAPLSPFWPKPSALHGPGAADLVVISLLTLLPLYLGRMVTAAVDLETVRSLEEDPAAILEALEPPEALDRAAALLRRRPDSARVVAMALTAHTDAAVRVRAWRLMADPALAVSTARLVQGLEGEAAPAVRLAVLEALRSRNEPVATEALEREAGGPAPEALIEVVRLLAGPEPDVHAELRRRLAQRLTGEWLGGRLPDATLRAALARAGDPDLAGVRAALESEPPGWYAPEGLAERTVRWIWRNAAGHGVVTARDGFPDASPLPARLRALLLGDLVPLVGSAHFPGRTKALTRMLREGAAPERYAAGYALYRLQPAEAGPALTLALEDSEPGVRIWAAMACTEMNGSPPGGVFESLFRDEGSPHRFDAAVFLLKYGHDESVVPYLIEQVGGPVGPMTRGVLQQAFGQDLGGDPGPWRTWWEGRRPK